MGREDQYRDKAAECFAMAGSAQHSDIALQYMELGFAYERLAQWNHRAAEIEDRLKVAVRLSGAGKSSRPN